VSFPYKTQSHEDLFIKSVYLIILAIFIFVLTFRSGDAMAALKPEDFFYGDYLKMAQAIDREDIESMRKISKRIDLNGKIGEKQMTVFVYAVANKKIGAMQELINLRADPTLVVSGVGAPLSLAASSDDLKLLEMLLKSGCNPNAEFDDEPLIFLAQLQDRKETVKMLLDYGADIEARDSIGYTVLGEAIDTTHYDMALYLIEQGANVHSKTFDGVSIAYSTERALARMSPGSPGARKLERIIDMMKQRGVTFPAAPPPKK
jgi:ankyrin repeat protein